MSTRIGLIGYGKMGRMIASLAPERDCEVVSIIDPMAPEAGREITAESVKDCEVCIDFSHPAAVVDNLHKLIALRKNIVVGTTGWNQHFDEISNLVEKAGTAFLYGANFSIGMSVFSRIVAEAAKYFDRFEMYDVYGLEQHHNQKADSPSGTAIELARQIVANMKRKDTLLFETAHRKVEPGELHFASVRGGSIPGTHMVGFDSEADTIELIHRARSRLGFASGALEAAKWLPGRKGCYSFSDMMNDLLC